MRFFTWLAFATFMLAATQSWIAISASAQERKGGAAQELVGRYELVSGEKDGQPIPDQRIKGSTMRIAANAMTTYDKDEKEVYVATYKLDTSSQPWRITMTAKVAPDKGEGSQAQGLVEKSGDTVKLIYALPGGKAPTGMKAGDHQQMFVLKKIGD